MANTNKSKTTPKPEPKPSPEPQRFRKGPIKEGHEIPIPPRPKPIKRK